jgi:hypothetical protein
MASCMQRTDQRSSKRLDLNLDLNLNLNLNLNLKMASCIQGRTRDFAKASPVFRSRRPPSLRAWSGVSSSSLAGRVMS